MIPGKTLRKIRENKGGVTQADVAHRLGIDPARVSVIESDRRGPISPELAQRYLTEVLDERVTIRADFYLVTDAAETKLSTVVYSDTREVDDSLICAYPEPES
jgi:transcriptional regulator with XRE-family HTH domain